MNTLIARNTLRNRTATLSVAAAVAARSTTTSITPRRSAPVRKYASDPSKNPAPPPLGPAPLDSAETKGSGGPLLIGGLVAALGVGWYYYSQTTKGQEKDVSLKARELDHAARVQAQQKVDQGKEKFDQAKADGRAKIDSAQSSVQSTYNDAAHKANSAAADAQARLASYKDAAAGQFQHSKEATEKAAHDAKAYSEEKANEAKSSWFGWLGWGKSKAEDAKEAAAGQAAKSASDVKEKAADVEKSAQKRA